MPTVRRFSCGRTCRPFTPCRFTALFEAAGIETAVVSHTTTVKARFRAGAAFDAAILALGGQVLGDGTFELYQTSETGYGFRLPGWNFPLVLKPNGSMAFDDFEGRWGNRADLKRLEGLYTIEAAKVAADGQGWINERQDDGSLLVHHPSGGTMTVYPDGRVDNNGFVGQGCDDASVIESAIGTEISRSNKCEYFSEYATIKATT